MKPKRMSFSRQFPAYHKRKGEPTYFVEKILTEIGIRFLENDYLEMLCKLNPSISRPFLKKFQNSLTSQEVCAKKHTIRSLSKQMQIGDKILPVCWAGRPYHKTKEGFWQIVFAPEIEVKHAWDLSQNVLDYLYENALMVDFSKNDGLTYDDLILWLKLPKQEESWKFSVNNNYQIICWDEKLKY